MSATETKFRVALEKIVALESVKEMRGPLEDMCVPDHLVKEGGWVPINPRMKQGMMLAVKIAKEALSENEPKQDSKQDDALSHKHLAFQDSKSGLEYELTFDGQKIKFGRQALPYDVEFVCPIFLVHYIFAETRLLLEKPSPLTDIQRALTSWKEKAEA